MTIRIVLLMSVFVLSLYATPTMDQLREELKRNPDLLETSQAKAMMRERFNSTRSESKTPKRECKLK